MALQDFLHQFIGNFLQGQQQNFSNLGQFDLLGPQGVQQANENARQAAQMQQTAQLHNTPTPYEQFQMALAQKQQGQSEQQQDESKNLNILKLLQTGGVTQAPAGTPGAVSYGGVSLLPHLHTIAKGSDLGKAMNLDQDMAVPEKDFIEYGSRFLPKTTSKVLDPTIAAGMQAMKGSIEDQINQRFRPEYYQGMYGQVDPEMDNHRKNFVNRLVTAIAEDQARGTSTRLQSLQKDIDSFQSPWEKMMQAKQAKDQAYKDQLALRASGHADTQAAHDQQMEEQSYRFHAGELDKLAKPVDDALSRFSRLKDTIDQGSKQADSLVAPELLSVMAGGSGSGLRMNEAEISRILGGRSAMNDLRASLMKVSPNGGLIPDEQRGQVRKLMDAVYGKLQSKSQILTDARSGLASSTDRLDHRKIFDKANRDLLDVDLGKSGGGSVQSQLGLSDEPKYIVQGGKAILNPNYKGK